MSIKDNMKSEKFSFKDNVQLGQFVDALDTVSD